MTKRLSFAGAASGGGGDGPRSTERSFDEVKRALAGQLVRLCHHLLPGGQVRGGEYVARNPRRSDKKAGSFSVNLTEGHFKDFASPTDAGADGISLWAWAKGISQVEAKREVEDWLGLPSMRVGRDAPVSSRSPAAETVAAVAGSSPAPAPDAPDDSDQTWYRSATPEMKWEYHKAGGAVWAIVYRYKHPRTGQKVVRPWDVERRCWEAPEGLRPLYNMAAVQRADIVVLVEGEKCADAINAIGRVGSTIMGGAVAVAKTDWSPLEGKHVILWRDNDPAGLEWEARVIEALRATNVHSARSVVIPDDKPQKWDAADAEEPLRKNLIHNALASKPVVTGRPIMRITDWTTSRYMDPAKPQEFLVNETFPLAVYSVVAAEGDTGKGMALVDLALKVAGGAPHLVNHPMSFGCSVARFGRAIVFSAEDSHEELLRRVSRLDPDRKLRDAAKDRLMLVPYPDMGGVKSLMSHTSHGMDVTEEFMRLCDQITALDDVALIVFDPLVSFIQADLNKDSGAAAFVGGQFAKLATDTGAAVIAAHHMAKMQIKQQITTPEQARAMIKGTSANVDAARAAYALWREQDGEAKRLLKTMREPIKGEDWRNRVIRGAIVKSNGATNRTVRTYIRDLRSGLLIDRTAPVAIVQRDQKSDRLSLMARSIAMAAKHGFPLQQTGANGVYTKRELLHPELRGVARDKLETLVKSLLDDGTVVYCRKGTEAAQLLDIKGGPLARGMAEIEIGAALPEEWWKEEQGS